MDMLLSHRVSADGTTVTIRIDLGSAVLEAFFRSRDMRFTVTPEVLGCLGLPLAMKADARLRLDGAASPAFLRGLHTISDILSSWYPMMKPLQVEAVTRAASLADAPAGARVGAFFSGGVDSFHTLLRHRDEITDLVLVRGFDIALGDERLWAEVSGMAGRVAAQLGKRLVLVETDVRRLYDAAGLWWGEHAHGAALACVAHLVGAGMRTVFVPASHTYNELFPWGSHPLLDLHWGTEQLAFRHDGCEATRVDKVRFIAQHPIALSSLRVCYENRGGAYNCGRCEKCLRTMLNLVVAGALDRATTFPTRLKPKAVRAMTLRGDNGMAFARENIDALAQVPGAQALRRALRVAFLRARLRAGLVSLLRRLPYADTLLVWRNRLSGSSLRLSVPSRSSTERP